MENTITKKELSPAELAIKRQNRNEIIRKVICYIFLTFMALVVLVPFYWMINTSLKDANEILLTPPTMYPHSWAFVNYVTAMQKAAFGRYFINTIGVGVVSTILTLITTIMAAFAFARLNFKGRDAMFALILATMMIPGEMFVLSNYVTVAKFGWLKGDATYLSLIVPFIVSVFYIYLLRQSFKQIPNELYLAAKVDGTSDIKYLVKVMIPLAMPTIITITILKLMGSWNSYIWPNLVASSDKYKLITNGLRTAFTDAEGFTSFHYQMAAAVIISAPLFVIFIFFRKYIMRGVARSGIKG